MQSRSLDMGYHFVQALEHLNEATQSLSQFSESIFTYVDNNHTPFTIDQVDDLKEVHTALIKLLDEYCKMLQTGTYIQFDLSLIHISGGWPLACWRGMWPGCAGWSWEKKWGMRCVLNGTFPPAPVSRT